MNILKAISYAVWWIVGILFKKNDDVFLKDDTHGIDMRERLKRDEFGNAYDQIARGDG